MLNWLSSLFSKTERKELKSLKKKYTRLNEEQKRDLVVDKLINKMTYAQMAKKYNISESTVGNIIRAARRL